MKRIVIEGTLYKISDSNYRKFETLRNARGDRKDNHYRALKFMTENFKPSFDLDGVFNF